jgi:DNA polymerase-1
VRRIAKDRSYVKLFHHAKYDLQRCDLEDIDVQGPIHCTMLMCYVLDPRRPHGLKELSAKLGEDISDQSDMRTWIKEARRQATASIKAYGYYILDGKIEIDPGRIQMQHAPWDLVGEYAKKDAERTILLFYYAKRGIAKDPYRSLYLKEMKLMRITKAMEDRGMRWNMPMAYRLLKIINMDKNNFHKEGVRLAGHDFNMLSPKQIANVLFNEIGLAVAGWSDAGNPITDKDTLVTYDHPLVTQILRYRMARKMDGYMRNFIRSADKEGEDWVIHASLLQHGTITGRYSVTNPPLQTTPAMDTGRRSHYIVNIRKCFVPREGYLFYMLDFAQIEIKLFVHFSDEPEMRKIVEAGRDFHGEVATQVTGVPSSSKEFDHVRKLAKMVNFGLIYGAGLNKIIKITREEPGHVERFYHGYHRKFRGVRTFMDRIISKAGSDGAVTTPFGRRIPVDRHKAYKAVNYLIQGTAADVLKSGIIKAAGHFTGAHGFPIHTMHDEIIGEVPIQSRHYKQVNQLREDLESCGKQFSVPLNVDFAISATSWGDETKIKETNEQSVHRSVAQALWIRGVQEKEAPRLRELRLLR